MSKIAEAPSSAGKIDIQAAGVIERSSVADDAAPSTPGSDTSILKDLMGEESGEPKSRGRAAGEGPEDVKVSGSEEEPEGSPADEREAGSEEEPEGSPADEKKAGSEEEPEGSPANEKGEGPVFDQAAFDARMAELAGTAAPAGAVAEAAPVATPVAPAAPEASAGALTGEFREKIAALRVDPAKREYEGEREQAETHNKTLDLIEEVVAPMLDRFNQVESMYIRQVAEGVARELQAGAELVAKTYGIQIKPEQMDGLLRRNQDLAQKAGGFTAAVVRDAFERENWRELMAVHQARTKQVPRKAEPRTLPSSAGAGRMHAQGQKLTDDELILRDLE